MSHVSDPAQKNWKDTDLVPLAEVDPTLVIDLPLSRAENPWGFVFYRENQAYLRYGTARKLAAAQKDFAERGLRLKIWDAYRPFAVQVKMFLAVGGNGDWVSDPWKASGKKTHVRGVAIDCTLIDQDGNELSMPTPYLDFQHGAEKMKHGYMKLPQEVLAHRKLLRETMEKHGLEAYPGEWWHYQDKNWERYPVVAMKDQPELHRRMLVPELLSEEFDEER
ncbi:M15 family metallopeptidase [bacterium]|nr:M15 family metallopeptidase [bacterium]